MEAGVMPVADHLDMLSAQYLASALRPSHPSHAVVTAPSGPRSMKATLQSKHQATVAPYLRNGVIEPATYKQVIGKIHTSSVSASISKLGVNRLLGDAPPKIASEVSLTRAERSTLSQLRTGHCKRLNDYKHSFLQQSPTAICPECLFRRHTASHLFDCDARPTDLSIRDLWTSPVSVVTFLKSLPSFSFLLPPNPPPPPPPPEPPP